MEMSQAFAFKRRPGKQRGVTYVLIFWSILALLAMGAFFQEGIALFSGHPTSFMNDTEFFITFGVVILCGVTFGILVSRNFKIGIHWGWLIAFLLLFAANAAGTFLLDPHVVGAGTYHGEAFTYDYTFTLMERIRYLCAFANTCVLLYMYFAVFPKLFHNTRRLHVLFYLALLAGLALIVYSLIVERDVYACIFDGSKPWRTIEAKSFTNNPNTFGFGVLLAMVAVFFLHNQRSHWWWIVLMFVLGLFQLILGSGSACLASWALIVAFVIYRFCVTLKYHTGAALFWFFVFWAAAITLTVLIFTEAGGDGSVFARVGKALKSAQFSEGAGRLRVETWNRITTVLDSPLKWAFGVGEPQCFYYLGLLEQPSDAGINIVYAHSGFFHQLLAGGIVRFGFYILLLARFMYLCIKGAKRHSRVTWACFICMGAVLLRSCFETTSYLSTETKGAVVYLMLVLPVEVDEFLACHPEVKGYEEEALADNARFVYRYDMTPMRMAKVALLFVTPACALALGLMPQFNLIGDFNNYATWNYYVMWSLAFLCIPFGFYCIGHHADKTDRRLFGTFLAILYIGALIAGTITAKFAPIVSIVMMALIPALTLFTYLLHARSVNHFRQKLFLHGYLPHLLILAFLIGLACLGYLIPKADYSIYNPIMMGVAMMVVYLGALYTAKGDELSYPLCVSLQRFDCRRTAKGIIKEREMVYRQTYYLRAGHMPPTSGGKTYYARY